MIETVNRSELMSVRFAYSGENSLLNESRIRGRVASRAALSCQVLGSRTPLWIQPTSSAGAPPRMNIHRHPKFAPIV
jgi:hypothetical protein